MVLITGGAGFIGSHIVQKLLNAGHRVRILDSLSEQVHGVSNLHLDWLQDSRIEFIKGSVTCIEVWKDAIQGVETIIHLASETGTGQSMYQIAHYTEVNTMGTALLFDALRQSKSSVVKRVLLASSRSIYGEGAYICEHCASRVFPPSRTLEQFELQQWQPQCPTCKKELTVVATTETDRASPASIYAATKYAQEDIVRVSCESMDLEYTILRLQNVYGEGQSLPNPYTGILSIFSTKIRRGLELPLFEDGLESRDFVHVEDVAEVFYRSLAAVAVKNKTMNVGSGRATSVVDMCKALHQAFNKDEKLKVTGQYRIGDIRHNFADISGLKQLLNFEPQISSKEGLQRFAKWVELEPLPEDKLEQANQVLRDNKLMN